MRLGKILVGPPEAKAWAAAEAHEAERPSWYELHHDAAPPRPFCNSETETTLRLGIVRLFEEWSTEARAIRAFQRRYPAADLEPLRLLLAELRVDSLCQAVDRGVDLEVIDPPALIERLAKDPRVFDLDQWLEENHRSMAAQVFGSQGRLDHLSELREAEVRLENLPPEGFLSVAENSIPGTDRYADLKSDEAYVEVKTLREPMTGWQAVTGQLSDALQKFSLVEDDGRKREVVIYAVLDPQLHGGIRRGNLQLRYEDGVINRRRLDNGELIHSEAYWAPLVDWLNGLAAKQPIDNPGLLKADRINVRVDGGVSATLERGGGQWALR